MVQTEIINEAFTQRFRTTEGSLYAAPGRVNLIGEHTDYNDGFVFPGAIDKGITAKINSNGTMTVRAYALDLNEYAEFDLNFTHKPDASWACYIYGVCCEMHDKGIEINGFDTVFAGDIPLGAGLSSSAALESCFAFALNDLFGNNALDKMELARIGQRTEHNYVGVKCGIMDQFASVFGKAGYLMRLDCSSMNFEYYPFDPQKYGYRVVLLDSVVKHELVDSPYNKRRESCERVARQIGVKSLRYAEMDDLQRVKNQISGEDYLRAKYVIEEKQRVLDVCEALHHNDYVTVGECMFETHKGLSDEVSCVELDFLNNIARECNVTGSRMMGGGFGGCTINLVKEEYLDVFIETAQKEFSDKYGHLPNVYEVVISQGAHKIDE